MSTIRNELHLREFILQHLITGFSHIVITDDNLVEKNQDTDISLIVEPFVKIGVVTVIPSSRRKNSSTIWSGTRSGQALFGQEREAGKPSYGQDYLTYLTPDLGGSASEGQQSTKNDDDMNCINIYGIQSDWTALLDADEYFSIVRSVPF